MNPDVQKVAKGLRAMKYVALIVICIFAFHSCLAWTSGRDYETCDISDYGNYVGNSPEKMEMYIERFFPAEIKDYFHDVTYVFHSRAIDHLGFEAYLEFVIEDDKLFAEHVQSATKDLVSGTFRYDQAFQEYLLYDSDIDMVYDHINLSGPHQQKNDEEMHYHIQYADIAKILVDYDDHRIIYIAMSVFDGGGSDTEQFDAYFDRFDIEPKEYEKYTKTLSRRNS